MLIDKMFRATQKCATQRIASAAGVCVKAKRNKKTAAKLSNTRKALETHSATTRLEKEPTVHTTTARLTRLSGDVNDARIAKLGRIQNQSRNHSPHCSQSKTNLRVPAILQTKSLSEFFMIAEREQQV